MSEQTDERPESTVIVSMPFEHARHLIIQPGDVGMFERIWLNRDQALHLLEVLPEWINKLPVALKTEDR